MERASSWQLDPQCGCERTDSSTVAFPAHSPRFCFRHPELGKLTAPSMPVPSRWSAATAVWNCSAIRANLTILDLIDDHRLVTGVYGQWPTFAGADILGAHVELSAFDFDKLGERQLNLTLHWWLGAPEHYPDGPRHYDASDLHRRITFAFLAEDIRIRTFHCSDTSINSLDLSRRGDQLKVKCVGGFELETTAFGAKILDVSECNVIGELVGS